MGPSTRREFLRRSGAIDTTTMLQASDFVLGFADVTLDTTSAQYVRAIVRDSSGVVVALTNPAWLLRDVPPGGIPQPRSG